MTSNQNTILIYLIEDNKIDSMIADDVIKRTLPQAIVEFFFDASSAITSLQNIFIHQQGKLPDLIFLDMAMPEMDGFGFLDHYKKLPLDTTPSQPLLYILTTTLSATNIAKAKSYPYVKDVLFKIFSQKAFAAILDKHFPHLEYIKPKEHSFENKKELTIDNWVSEYKRLERTYIQVQDKQSLEARGILDQMEAVWLIILDMNNKNKPI